jgi:hypothetical protein
MSLKACNAMGAFIALILVLITTRAVLVANMSDAASMAK